MPSIWESHQRAAKRHTQLTSTASERLQRLATPKQPPPVKAVGQMSSAIKGNKNAFSTSAIPTPSRKRPRMDDEGREQGKPSIVAGVADPKGMSFKFGTTPVGDFAKVQLPII